MKPDQPDYGLDAPKLVRNFLVGGSLAVIAGVLVIVFVPGWIGGLGGIAVWIGAFFAFEGVLMILSSRYGKFKLRDQLLGRLNLTGIETVLDVGCGRGLLLIGAAKRLPKGRAFGLDLWSQYDLSDNRASATLINADLEGVKDRVEIQNGDMREMPFTDARFDVITASLSIHNIYNVEGRQKAIQEIVRVLKPGGKVALLDMQHVKKYARYLSEAGMVNVRVSALNFWMFPPVRIVTASQKDRIFEKNESVLDA
jgi:ubiquinone/menaquinone biosynthesis C-methylase UbiE